MHYGKGHLLVNSYFPMAHGPPGSESHRGLCSNIQAPVATPSESPVAGPGGLHLTKSSSDFDSYLSVFSLQYFHTIFSFLNEKVKRTHRNVYFCTDFEPSQNQSKFAMQFFSLSTRSRR